MKKLSFRLSLLLFFSFGLSQSFTLEECIAIALKNKETLKASALDLESSRLSTRSSYSVILPSLSFSGSMNETRFPPRLGAYNPGTGELELSKVSKYSSWSSGISVSQTIYDGGKWWSTISQAKNNYQISKQLDRQVLINIIREVHRAFFAHLKAQQLLEVARLNLKSSKRQLELVKHQFDLGAVKKTDLLKAEVSLGQAEVEVINQKTALKTSYQDLKNALGLIGSGYEFEIADAGRPLKPIPELKEATELMEANNPSLLAKRYQIVGAKLNKKITTSARIPTLSANLNYSGSASEYQKLINKWNDNWQLRTGLTLSFPLYTGNSLSTQAQQATLSIRKQESEYLTQLQDLKVQLINQLETLENYRKIIPINEKVQYSAEEDLKLAQERYTLGAATILEVLDAQVSVLRAKSSVITAKYDARIQQANLKALLGTLDSELQ